MTTIMERGPLNHNGDGILGNSIMVVYMEPLGNCAGLSNSTGSLVGSLKASIRDLQGFRV